MEPQPRDVLGQFYMELEIASKDQGQFFTLPHLCELMAKMSFTPDFKDREREFITLSDPACGAGGTVLAVVKIMIEQKIGAWVTALGAGYRH